MNQVISRVDNSAQEVCAVVVPITSTTRRVPQSGNGDASKAELIADKGVYVLHQAEAGSYPSGHALVHVVRPIAGVKVSIGTNAKPDLFFKDADLGTVATLKATDASLVADLGDNQIIMTVTGSVDPTKDGYARVTIPLVSTHTITTYR
jgi:hypothetical protein